MKVGLELDSVVISYGHTEPLNAIMELKHIVSNILPRRHRSAYAKFRCGEVPIRLEMRRYERLSIDQRTCFHCTRSTETEEHVLLVCPLYDDLRHMLLSSIYEDFPYFDTLSNDQKLSVILSCDSVEILRLSAKTCYDILMRRRLLLYN